MPRPPAAAFALALGLFAASIGSAAATGLATCKSGPQSGWKSQDALKAKLVAQGWEIRRIKVDGGCYEVYAFNEKKERVKSYFHPVTFEHVLTSRR